MSKLNLESIMSGLCGGKAKEYAQSDRFRDGFFAQYEQEQSRSGQFGELIDLHSRSMIEIFLDLSGKAKSIEAGSKK